MGVQTRRMGAIAARGSTFALRVGPGALAVCAIVAALACSDGGRSAPATADVPPPAVPGSASSRAATVEVVVAGETFEVEVAADPKARFRGLSGRGVIPRNGGMLFVLPRPERMAMVMRDCPNAIDVAFIDAMGRVVAVHEMPPEPPRRDDESPFQYERRLPAYPSGAPVSFALEIAGGRLAELGLETGDRLHFSAQSLTAQARSATTP